MRQLIIDFYVLEKSIYFYKSLYLFFSKQRIFINEKVLTTINKTTASADA